MRLSLPFGSGNLPIGVFECAVDDVPLDDFVKVDHKGDKAITESRYCLIALEKQADTFFKKRGEKLI